MGRRAHSGSQTAYRASSYAQRESSDTDTDEDGVLIKRARTAMQQQRSSGPARKRGGHCVVHRMPQACNWGRRMCLFSPLKALYMGFRLPDLLVWPLAEWSAFGLGVSMLGTQLSVPGSGLRG